MHKTHGKSLFIALVAAAFITPVIAVKAEQAGPRRGPVAANNGVVAREWGVWKLRGNRIAHLEELAAETPAFVFRNAGAPASNLPAPIIQVRPQPIRPRPQPIRPVPQIQPFPQPVPRPHPAVSRKPVLFLYTKRPVDLTIQVGFNGGQPWLYYPAANLSSSRPNSQSLTWQGHLVPSAQAPLQPAPRGHWWNDLRQVGADLFLSEQGSAERFLFYDGPVAFERPFVIQRRPGGALVQPMSSEHNIWLVFDGQYQESRVQRGAPSTIVGQGDMAALRTRLDAELQARGLSRAEARALLETWRDDLFNNPAQRAVYFVPRHLYDRMLPMRIDPPPAELVRVGLVIEEL